MPKQPPVECRNALQRLRLLVTSLGQSARAVEQRTGVTNAQLFILRELAEAGPFTINQLAERALTGQNTVSAVVTRLEAGRLVRRSRSATDGRVVMVAITAAGRRLSEHAPESPTERLLSALCDLSPAELRSVTRAIGLLNERLGVPEDADTGMLFEGSRAAKRGARVRTRDDARPRR